MSELLLILTKEVVADLFITARSLSHPNYPENTNVSLDYLRTKIEKRLKEFPQDTLGEYQRLWSSLNDLLTALKSFNPTNNNVYTKRAFIELLENFQKNLLTSRYDYREDVAKLEEIIRELKQ